VLRRLIFVIFFCLGGFLFYIPKWILMGTKRSRDRKEMLRLQKETNKLLLQQQKQANRRFKGQLKQQQNS
jgi:hypothetical protein